MMQRIVLIGMLALAGAGSAQAQVAGINLQLGAKAGMFSPVSKLAETDQGDLKLGSGFAIGASVEADLPMLPFNLRANLDGALSMKLEVAGDEFDDTEVDLVVITGDLVWRLAPRRAPLQPYLLAGLGVKRYTFESDFGNVADSESHLTGHLGVGADFKVGPLAVLVEASDFISSFENELRNESKLQNDLFLMVGFRIGML